MAFTKAKKTNATIKLALTGTSGSGKTYSALLIAKGLGGKTALLDTEYGSASLYADKFDFDTWDEIDPNGFPPEYFINVIKAAEDAGYKNLIIDSISHEWNGKGGCLELADAIGRAKFGGNSYAAWGVVTPRHNKLVETILASKMNILATMRAKTEYVLNKNEKTGKSTPQKVGLGVVQRDGMEYEFTIMFDLDRDSHLAVASKDRSSLFADPVLITENTGCLINEWLSGKKNDIPDDIKPITTDKNVPELKVIAPAPQKSNADRAREYLQAVITKRLEIGHERSAIIKFFADVLQTDKQREIEEMTDDEVCYLGTELKKLAQRQRANSTTNG